jgi:hypothetical protein
LRHAHASKSNRLTRDPDPRGLRRVAPRIERECAAITQHLNDDSKTRRWFGELEAPSRQLHAHIDEQHRLVVRDAAGRERVVDRGTYEQCEGETIGIIDWVDDDRYLVYRISGEHYIADPRTGQRALLFDSAPPDAAYVW